MADSTQVTGTGDAAFAKNLQNAQNVQISDDQRQAIPDAAGGDAQKAATMENLLRIENRGFGFPNNDAHSPAPANAYGAWQFVQPTWERFGEGNFRNAGDFEKGAQATAKFIDWIANRYGTSDPAVIAAYYNGGGVPAYAVAHGKALPPGETNDYVRMMDGLTQSSQPVPATPDAPSQRVSGTDMLPP